MMQTGLFDWQTRFEQLDNGGDPLVKLSKDLTRIYTAYLQFSATIFKLRRHYSLSGRGFQFAAAVFKLHLCLLKLRLPVLKLHIRVLLIKKGFRSFR